MSNKNPKLEFLIPGGKKRLDAPKVRKQFSLTQEAVDGLEKVAKQYGLIRDGRGDVSELLELIGKGNLLVVPMPPQLNS